MVYSTSAEGLKAWPPGAWLFTHLSLLLFYLTNTELKKLCI